MSRSDHWLLLFILTLTAVVTGRYGLLWASGWTAGMAYMNLVELVRRKP